MNASARGFQCGARDPDWDYSRSDVTKLRRDARAAGAMLNATHPDLKPFSAKGGKLIVWHGWADPALSALATIRYHEQVHARDAQADGYLRTFLLPGVQHCGDGEGPDQVDWTSAIDDWVPSANRPDPIPVMLLAGLAVDAAYQRQGIGSALLKDALLRTVAAAQIAGIRAMLIHACQTTRSAFTSVQDSMGARSTR